MPQQSNGRYRLPATESQGSTTSTTKLDSHWVEQVEGRISNAHEAIVDQATHFIRERPGVSLAIAVALGGVIGWLIKRRG